MGRSDEIRREALYALEVEAFLEGLAQEPPRAEEHGVSPDRAKAVLRIVLKKEAA